MKLGIVGCGWLGGAIAKAALDAGVVAPQDLALSWRSAPPAGFDGAWLTRDNRELADRCDVIVLAVRPEDWATLELRAPGRLVVSVMAGIGMAALAGRHGTDRIVRALPNAAAQVRASHTPLLCSAGSSAADRAAVRALFAACGDVDEVADEAQLDYLSGLTGTGPAYPALMALAMERDAVARGIDPAVARRAVLALLVGTGRMIEADPQAPEAIVERFMAYRGVTAAGLDAMRAGGLDAAVRAGLAAALARAQAMGGD
ncbi:MAG: NAD(P)-binding domain-containing protein [Sphingomonadales bacterium]|nr:NAD(P)-binding domain-containing protein [Sphingomonadales bacterium]